MPMTLTNDEVGIKAAQVASPAWPPPITTTCVLLVTRPIVRA